MKNRNREEKWRLWKRFQIHYVRALHNAKNANEELPLPDESYFPNSFLDDLGQDQVSDTQIEEIIQLVVDAIEKRLKKKGLDST